MAHSFFHAKSSVRTWGGELETYLPIHNWFDATKAIRADFRHRALRHHLDGLDMICSLIPECMYRRFKDNSLTVNTRWVAEQHLAEDFPSKPLPTVEDWFKGFLLPGYRTIRLEKLCETIASKFGGAPSDYTRYCVYMLEGHRAVKHHSWGIFDAEALIGTSFVRDSDGKNVPTRTVMEAILFQMYTRIPTPDDWLDNVKQESWMFANAKQLSKEEL